MPNKQLAVPPCVFTTSLVKIFYIICSSSGYDIICEYSPQTNEPRANLARMTPDLLTLYYIVPMDIICRYKYTNYVLE